MLTILGEVLRLMGEAQHRGFRARRGWKGVAAHANGARDRYSRASPDPVP
jgi:hypothetical protein